MTLDQFVRLGGPCQLCGGSQEEHRGKTCDQVLEARQKLISDISVPRLLPGAHVTIVNNSRNPVRINKSPHDMLLQFDLTRLTPAEHRTMSLIAKGHATKEAARILRCAPATVERHRHNVRKKFGIRSNTVEWMTLLREFPL